MFGYKALLYKALLYKAWLETRYRLLLGIGFHVALFIGFALIKPPASSPVALMVPADQVKALLGFGFVGYAVAWVSILLAGAGIATQSAFQQTKGLHGSTLFTLSLPVTRFRLIAVRAGLGWLETAGFIGVLCLGIWIVFPALRATAAPKDVLNYALALIACSSSLYAIPMLLATFLDDVWRMFGSGAVFALLWWVFYHSPLPASINFFRAMGEGSPLVVHAMPWNAMACSLALSAVLFFAALKIVQQREY